MCGIWSFWSSFWSSFPNSVWERLGEGNCIAHGGGVCGWERCARPQTPPPCETECRSSVRSQTEFGNEAGEPADHVREACD